MGSIDTLLPVLLGAAIGFVPNYLLERQRERTQLRTRWDGALLELCSQFTASARNLDNLAGQSGAGGAAGADLADRLADEHHRLRALGEQIRLLGSHDVQAASRWVVRHAFAVRELAEGRPDPRADEYPDRLPRDRLRDSLDALYLAARVQLHVPGARLIAPREPGRASAPSATETGCAPLRPPAP